jgi:hypothetical protein
VWNTKFVIARRNFCANVVADLDGGKPMRLRRLAVAVSAFAAVPQAVLAEVARPPVPDLITDPKTFGDDRKYVVFHKDGVSFSDALQDISECARHARRAQHRTAPSFVAWGRDQTGKLVSYDSFNFGLTGLVIASIIDGPIERSARQTVMIRCLTPMGYQRYRAASAQWQAIFEGRDDWVPVAAAIASGPTPSTPKVD